MTKSPEQMIEERSGTPFHQNHPVLDRLDFGDVRDLMKQYAISLKEGWQREAWTARGEIKRYTNAGHSQPRWKTFEDWNRDELSRVGKEDE